MTKKREVSARHASARQAKISMQNNEKLLKNATVVSCTRSLGGLFDAHISQRRRTESRRRLNCYLLTAPT